MPVFWAGGHRRRGQWTNIRLRLVHGYFRLPSQQVIRRLGDAGNNAESDRPALTSGGIIHPPPVRFVRACSSPLLVNAKSSKTLSLQIAMNRRLDCGRICRCRIPTHRGFGLLSPRRCNPLSCNTGEPRLSSEWRTRVAEHQSSASIEHDCNYALALPFLATVT
jgi:hypothetical protein